MTDGRLGLKRWEPVFDWYWNDGFCFLYPPFWYLWMIFLGLWLHGKRIFLPYSHSPFTQAELSMESREKRAYCLPSMSVHGRFLTGASLFFLSFDFPLLGGVFLLPWKHEATKSDVWLFILPNCGMDTVGALVRYTINNSTACHFVQYPVSLSSASPIDWKEATSIDQGGSCWPHGEWWFEKHCRRKMDIL